MLKKILEAANISYAELARDVSVDRKTIYNWVKNPRAIPVVKCRDIAHALHINKANCFLAVADNDRQALERIKHQLFA